MCCRFGVCWRLEVVLRALEMLDGMHPVLLCMLEAVEGSLCLLEVLEMPEVMRCVLEAAEVALKALEVLEGVYCVLGGREERWRLC